MASERTENSTGAGPVESPLIVVADFPLLWQGNVCTDDFDFRADTKKQLDDEEVQNELGVSPEIAAELANVCSPDTMKLAINTNIGKMMESNHTIMEGRVPEGGEQLNTVRLRAAHFQKFGRAHQIIQNRWYHYDFEDTQAQCTLSDPVVLLNVSVGISNKASQVCRHMSKHDRELLVHANQPLTALKEKLVCPLDLVYLCGECSEFPETADDTNAQDRYKSSFFFIENVFYNDTRDPEAGDISKPVREWLNTGKSDLITDYVKCAKMEENTFNDLSIRLGVPYLYSHQGDCEHTIIFTDIRFMHNKDCLDLEQYPILLNQSLFYKTPCHSCKLMTAKWMTREDSLAPADPCFFCDVCYYKFHYDGKGTKVGTFKAFRHRDSSIFR